MAYVYGPCAENYLDTEHKHAPCCHLFQGMFRALMNPCFIRIPEFEVTTILKSLSYKKKILEHAWNAYKRQKKP